MGVVSTSDNTTEYSISDGEELVVAQNGKCFITHFYSRLLISFGSSNIFHVIREQTIDYRGTLRVTIKLDKGYEPLNDFGNILVTIDSTR